MDERGALHHKTEPARNRLKILYTKGESESFAITEKALNKSEEGVGITPITITVTVDARNGLLSFLYQIAGEKVKEVVQEGLDLSGGVYPAISLFAQTQVRVSL